MSAGELPVCFPCAGTSLVGIAHPAARPARTGVLIVVGGPQYRVGSHRQFVLLARALADAGIPVFRFDVRGMGDSGGDFPGFEAIGDDIEAAMDAFTAAVPGLERIVLWGLCDAASASLFHAHRDRRIAGLVLLNPWVRTEATYARAELKHYYLGKITDRAFWRRLVTRQVAFGEAVRSLWQRIRIAARPAGTPNGRQHAGGHAIDPAAPLSDRMAQGLAAFAGPVLLIISGRDLTAREFEDVARASPLWTAQLSQPRVQRRGLAAADHTFSRTEWTEAVNAWTIEWVAALDGSDRALQAETAASVA